MNKKEKLNKIKLALSKLLEVQMSYITTDKGILYFEGENLKVDQQVWLKDENEENLTPEAGTYVSETQEFKIEGGRIAEISDIDINKQKFSIHKEEMAATYQEIERKLVDLMWELGYDCYLIENNSEYAIFDVWGEFGDMYLRLDITVDPETGDILSLSNPTEMVRTYVEKFEEQPVATVEPEPSTEEPVATVEPEPATEEPAVTVEPEPATEEPAVDKDKLLAEALETIEALRKQVADLQAQPMAKSPAEEFENVKKLEKTGDERVDTLLANRGFLFKK